MQTFTAHLSQKQALDLAEQVFYEMALRGIDPNLFVDWYAKEGIHQETLLIENALGSMIGNTLGGAWRAGSGLANAGMNVLKKTPGFVKNTVNSATDSLGRHIDKSRGRQGIQQNPASPSGYYDMNTGHYVKGQFDPTPIDRTGNPLPPELAKRRGPIEDASKVRIPQAPQYDDYEDEEYEQPQAQKTQAPQANSGSPVDNAMSALSNLSKVLVNSRTKQNPLTQNQRLIQGLHHLLGSLRNMPKPQVQPPPQPVRTQNYGGAAGMASNTWGGNDKMFDHHSQEISNLFLEMKVKQICEELLKHNVNPDLFVEWYQENHNLNEFNQGVRDWWGRMKRRFSNAWHGFNNGGNDYMADAENQQITQTVQQVVQSLQMLKNELGNNPDIISQLDAVLKELQNTNTQPQQDHVPEQTPQTMPVNSMDQGNWHGGDQTMDHYSYDDEKAFLESIYGKQRSRWFI